MEDKRYLVTARKWRPTTFDDVIGQEHITQALKNSIKFNKIAHAFIFGGPRGIGKTSTARILAKSLNCLNLSEYNPCNECEICASITNGSNFDVIEIDGASNRRIDEIRTLRESVKYAPSMGKYKVYIIDEVHMLTTESFNALLKTLEEPPQNVIFIFATTDMHKVPTTILSRCQKYDFRRLTMDEIKIHLKKIADTEKINYDDDALSIIAKKADGAMRDAQSLFDQMVVYSNGNVVYEQIFEMLGIIDYDIYFRITDALINKNIAYTFEIVNDIYFKGFDIHAFLMGLIEHFRNILSYQVTKDSKFIEASESVKERYCSLTEKILKSDLLRILSLLNKGQYEIKQSTNQKLYLEVLIAQLIQLPSSIMMEKVMDFLRKLKSDASNISINLDTENKNIVKSNKESIISPPIPAPIKTINKVPDQRVNSEQKEPTSNKKVGYKVTDLSSFTQKWNEFLEFAEIRRKTQAANLVGSQPVKYENKTLLIEIENSEKFSKIKNFESIIDSIISSFWSDSVTCKLVERSSSKPVIMKMEKIEKAKITDNTLEAFIKNELSGELIL